MKQGNYTIDNLNPGAAGRPLRAYNIAGTISGVDVVKLPAGKLRSEANPMELISWARERHAYYSSIGSEFLSKIGVDFTVPDFEIFAKDTRTAAWAQCNGNKCGYNLVHLLAAKELYSETIGHEIAHIVAWKMDWRSKDHGCLFKYVLEKVMKCQRESNTRYGRTNSHVQRAKAICKLINLKKGIENGKVL